jgi:hypothetical protein
MTGHDFIPKADGDFQTFLSHFTTGAAANQAELGLTDADVTALQGAATTYGSA